MDEIEGKLKAVIYHNEENLYSVIKIKINEETDNKYMTLTGNFPLPNDNTDYLYKGEYIKHPRFGVQFVVDKRFEDYSFYGKGPLENYCDRTIIVISHRRENLDLFEKILISFSTYRRWQKFCHFAIIVYKWGGERDESVCKRENFERTARKEFF